MRTYLYPKKTYGVSVIIPLYNAEKYIGECLDSLLAQTFQDFEVIVVDDCSTDNSFEVVQSYVPKFNGRLNLVKLEKNTGSGALPRNKGLSLASGEYVIFIDADDFILLTALETLYNVAKEYDADVVYTSSYYDLRAPNDIYLYRDGEGNKLLRDGLEDKLVLRIDDQKANLGRLTLEAEGNFRNPWTKFLRRSFLLDNEIIFPKIPLSEDFTWCIEIYCHAKRFLRLPTPLLFYRLTNVGSVTKSRRKPSEQISHWISGWLEFVNSLRVLESKNKVLAENPEFCFGALRHHFGWFLYNTSYAREELSNYEIYEILHREFANDSSNYATPFFFSLIDAEKKWGAIRSQTIKKLEKENDRLKVSSGSQMISVIIPMYNAENYISECLDSLLAQTFKNFEVIVVDDCSTDKSLEIVKSYAPKFNWRLTLSKMEKNTGSGALPRNKGLSLSCGEYIQFLDADDMLTKTALEELYGLAKKYDSDVIYCEKHYESDETGKNIHVESHQKGNFVDKPTFESDDLDKKVQGILDDRYLTEPWNKFTKRNLIVTNEIFFPAVKISEDNIWNQGVLFCAKKFLRVPNIVYIQRMSNDSMTRVGRTAQQTINFWLNPVFLGLKALDDIMNRHEFFKANPARRFALLKKFISKRFDWTLESAKQLSEEDIYSAIKDEFTGKLGEYAVLIPALCTTLYNEKNTSNGNLEILRRFRCYFTARLDIKFTSTEGDFKVLSVSDDKANVKKPSWLNKDGIGYVIQSYAGKLEIVTKATANGQINLDLRGLDIRDPEDKSKRIPYWIDYTKFVVNDQIIFDTLTPAWHDKPFRYNLDVKADEEIKVEVEWLPHRDDTVNLSTNVKEIQEKSAAKDTLINKLQVTLDNEKKAADKQKVLIAELQAALDTEKKIHSDDVELIRKFSDYFTARIDLTLKKETERGGFKIVSVSDKNAFVRKAGWAKKNEVGYFIQSYVGKMEIVAKPTADGQIALDLRGLDVRNPEDRSKKIPYWIDYTKLVVNGEVLFEELTPVWHNKPFRYKLDVKADEEIKIQVEWQPHRSDT